ncbi:MAG TPA: hypothetical protein VD969_24820 [Symbiobacteriaceae bacterium]|nr:hypothetical protein [Symbiobacteriaceae bacterium]
MTLFSLQTRATAPDSQSATRPPNRVRRLSTCPVGDDDVQRGQVRGDGAARAHDGDQRRPPFHDGILCRRGGVHFADAPMEGDDLCTATSHCEERAAQVVLLERWVSQVGKQA